MGDRTLTLGAPSPKPADDDTTLPATPTAATADLRTVDPGTYAIDHEIARGGMGKISSATDLRHGRPVAIKELLGAGDERRFAREALITARLQHPSIVPVYEAGRWPGGAPFYAMKMVSGRPLDKALADATTLSARMALVPNLIAVCDALAYAHDVGVIHRDLKPSNVLVGSFGETVVIDWGLAKALRDPELPSLASQVGSGDMTSAGDIIGTPAYMAPEQARAESVDERADVFALGAMLYHVLAGSPPYEPSAHHVMLARLLDGPPPPLGERVTGVPPDLLAIVDKAMARDPDARYRDARGLAEDLRRFQTGQLVSAHSYTIGQRVQRFVRRHFAATVVATLAIVAIVTVSAIAVSDVVDERDRAAAERADADELARATLEDASRRLDRLGHLELLQPVARRAVDYYERVQRGGRLTDERAIDYADALRVLATTLDKTGHSDQAAAALETGRGLLAPIIERTGSPDAMRSLANILVNLANDDLKLGKPELADADAARALAERVLAIRADPEATRIDAYAVMFTAYRAWLDDDVDRARAGYHHALDILRPMTDREAALKIVQGSYELGRVERAAGKHDVATQLYADARARAQALEGDGDERDQRASVWVANVDLELASLAQDEARYADARTASARAITTYDLLHRGDPANRVIQSYLASSYAQAARADSSLGAYAVASAHAANAVELLQELIAAEPDNREWRNELTMAYHASGDVETAAGHLDAALAAYRGGVASARARFAREHTTDAQHELLWRLEDEGKTLLALGKPDDAVARFEEEGRLAKDLLDHAPANSSWLTDLADAEEALAGARLRSGDRTALQLLQSAVARREKVVAARPDDAEAAEALATTRKALDDARKIIAAPSH